MFYNVYNQHIYSIGCFISTVHHIDIFLVVDFNALPTFAAELTNFPLDCFLHCKGKQVTLWSHAHSFLSIGMLEI